MAFVDAAALGASAVEPDREVGYVEAWERSHGGFVFENAQRNARLSAREFAGAGGGVKFLKTGTTIVGVACKDGIIMAADTRATAGTIVADKDCNKVHHVADNILACGAGTAADLEHVMENMASQMKLLSMATGTKPRVCAVVTRLSKMLFRYQGHLGCAVVLGGVDATGPHLYQIYPHGSTSKHPFVSMGSGSLAATAVLEAGYRNDLTLEQAKTLAADAIRAGIFNDLGSGSNVNLAVVHKDGSYEQTRHFDKASVRATPPQSAAYKFARGNARVLWEVVEEHVEAH